MEDALEFFYWVVFVCTLPGMWKVNTKAGKPGWASLVPIYNLIVLMQIVRRPLFWVVLFIVPCVGLFVWLVVCIDLAKAFGKGPGFGLGLCFLSPIFWSILGFGDAVYQGAVYRGGGPRTP